MMPTQPQALTQPRRKTAKERLTGFFQWAYATLATSARPLMSCLCFFLTPYVRWFYVPSPFAAALLLAGTEKSSFFSLLGMALSLALRVLWGLDPDIWQYIALGLLWLLLRTARPRPGVETVALAGAAMLPRAIWSLFRADPITALLCCTAVPICMLSALFLRRGLAGLDEGLHRTDEKCALFFLCLLLVSGLGYFQIFSVNLGQVAAVLCTLAVACISGSLKGIAAGLFCGVALALCGHDSRLAFSLTVLGLLCGLKPVRRYRPLLPPAAMLSNLLAFFVMPLALPALGWMAVFLGALLCCFIGRDSREKLEELLSSEPLRSASMENAFITDYIGHLRQSIYSVAKALPQPECDPFSQGAELGRRLCEECSNREMCWGRARQRTEKLMETMLDMSRRGESIQEDHLPALSQQGCLRTQAIPQAARETLTALKKRELTSRRMQFQRDLTLTHLAATLGTLSDLEQLAAGESLNDLQAAHILRMGLEESRIPAKLLYARRVEGHLQAALQTEAILPIQRQLKQLLRKLEAEQELSLSISRVDKGHIELEEVPLYTAGVGTASLCAGKRLDDDDEDICGDSCVSKRCDGGRLLMVLCDGMGHGPAANAQSRKTLELLLLLLQSGYTRKQAIVAVNGIMLGMQESPEKFSTVDLADVDLWTGDVSFEKLGACASWIIRGNHVKKVDSSSLPLGIVEDARSTELHCRLHSGDILILMSDGVSEAFQDDQQLRRALENSLFTDPQRMADALIRNALLASGGVPRDDMTVMVLLLIDRRRQMK